MSSTTTTQGKVNLISTMAAALAAIQSAPIEVVTVADLDLDRKKNYRDDNEYDGDTLAQDMRENGQQEPILTVREGKKLRIIRGYRRAFQFQLAAERNLHFDAGPHANKPMGQAVEVKILPPLDPAVRSDLHMDHSQRRTLSKVGLFRAVEESLDNGKTERAIVVKLADLFNTFWQPDVTKVRPVTEDNGNSLLEFHRGTIQGIRAVWAAPTLVRDAYYDVMRGVRKWPTLGETKSLSKVYTEEKDKASIGAGITRDKPGPIFLAKWKALQEKHAKDIEKGKTTRAQTMMTNSGVQALASSRESMVLRLDCHVILKTASEETNALLDAFMTKVESGFTSEQKAQFASILAGADLPEEPKAETPAAAK